MPEQIVPRSTAPILYQLVDRIAQSVQLPTSPQIVLTREFNAGFGTVTWRQQPILYLGLPLLALLDGQELVSLVAHELTHAIVIGHRFVHFEFRASHWDATAADQDGRFSFRSLYQRRSKSEHNHRLSAHGA